MADTATGGWTPSARPPSLATARSLIHWPARSASSSEFRPRRVLGRQARTLGVTDYPSLAPLAEVLELMRQCSGALALGLRQLHVETGEAKVGSPAAAKVADLYLSTPWNQIEAGMAVALERPLLVAREKGVEGGVFDVGSSDRFIHQVEFGADWLESPRFRQPFMAWVADVQEFALTLEI